MTNAIYYQIIEATDEDSAYYLAKGSHRARTHTLESQVYAACQDAILQARNGRTEFARAIAGIVSQLPADHYAIRCNAEAISIMQSAIA